MNRNNQEFTCDICQREELHPYALSNEKMPPRWWSLQCTRDYCRLFVRDVCPRCWELFFARIFPQTVPDPPKPNPGVDLVLGLQR